MEKCIILTGSIIIGAILIYKYTKTRYNQQDEIILNAYLYDLIISTRSNFDWTEWFANNNSFPPFPLQEINGQNIYSRYYQHGSYHVGTMNKLVPKAKESLYYTNKKYVNELLNNINKAYGTNIELNLLEKINEYPSWWK
jgi:hypothetical protein